MVNSMVIETFSTQSVFSTGPAKSLHLRQQWLLVAQFHFPTLNVGIKIYPKCVPKLSRTLLQPISPGKWLMLSGMLWIWRTTMSTTFGSGRCVGWEYKEEVTTTWPRQEHGLPNELKPHTWNTKLFFIWYGYGTRASKDGLSCRGGKSRWGKWHWFGILLSTRFSVRFRVCFRLKPKEA